jgi:hypothetical protein
MTAGADSPRSFAFDGEVIAAGLLPGQKGADETER